MKHGQAIILLVSMILILSTPCWGSPAEAELREFFDMHVTKLMDEHQVAGAVVGATDGERTLFQKGYGMADVEKGLAADPAATRFRPGSITKLFTWTAIMQLEERGLLELSDPVEQHLDFDLPDTFDEPVRIIDLMNHTPGFEDRMIGLMVTDKKYRTPLGQLVREDIPRRVRPPGEESSYSNYGSMLAGYIVERISGLSYPQYIREHIFKPLGMSASTMLQPPPERSGLSPAKGYAVSGDHFVEQPFEYVNGAPAGALSSTAADMLRFYRAYLGAGTGPEGSILEAETVRRMRRSSFRHDPRANGMAHGFIEMGQGPYPVLGHGGDTIFFHSLSGYLPTKGWAYFISTNTATGSALAFTLQQRLLNKFHPVPEGAGLAQEELAVNLQEYTGRFTMDRRSESDPTQIMGLFAAIKPVVSEGGDGLFISSILDPEGSTYVPVAKDLFQQRDGGMQVVFLRDGRDRVKAVYSNDLPVFLFSRPPWIEGLYLNLAVFGAAVLLMLASLIAPPTGLLGLIPALRRSGSPAGLGLTRIGIWSYLGFIALQVGVVLSLGNIIFTPIGPAHAIPLYLAALSVPVMLTGLVRLWKQGELRFAGRLYLSVYTGAQALFIALLAYWGFFFF